MSKNVKFRLAIARVNSTVLLTIRNMLTIRNIRKDVTLAIAVMNNLHNHDVARHSLYVHWSLVNEHEPWSQHALLPCAYVINLTINF
jgi:hypothetical protein